MARDPILWMRQEYSDIVETVRSHATKIVKHDRIRGGDDVVPPEQLTVNADLPSLKVNAILSSSGDTLTISPVDSGLIPLYGDATQGWVNCPLLSATTLSSAGFTSGRLYDIYVYYDSQIDPPGISLEAVIWTNETTRSVVPSTQDGVSLKSTDTSRRLLAVCRYNGTSLLVPKYDPNGETIFGTGDPRNNTADPHTGVGMSAGGVTFGSYVWQFWAAINGVVGVGFNALGQLLAGAGAVILDALGITLTQGIATQNAIKWVYGATEIFRIGASGTSSVTSTISTFSPSAGAIADMDMRVTGNGAVTAEINIRSYPSGQSIVEINKGVVDVDTAVHGSSANLIYADASANAVGFGTDTPSERVDVVGNGKFSGTLVASNLSGTNTGNQTIALTGDVTGSGTGSFAATIANAAVTLAKMANMATASLIYRKTAGSGAPEVNTLATLKTDLAIPSFIGANMGGATVALSSTVFIGPYMSIPVASFALSAWDVPNAGTLKNFYIRTNSTQPASGSLVFTIYQNSSGTTLTITIAAGAAANNAASDTTHSVSVSAGDRLSVQVVNNATAASAQITGLSFEFNAA